MSEFTSVSTGGVIKGGGLLLSDPVYSSTVQGREDGVLPKSLMTIFTPIKSVVRETKIHFFKKYHPISKF